MEIADANVLSALLDQQRSDDIEHEAQNLSSSGVLQKFLSTKATVARGGPEFVNKTVSRYRSIGFGQCGLIFERPGHSYVVKAARACFEDALWTDFVCHQRVYAAFTTKSGAAPECCVPEIYSYVTKGNKTWWDSHQSFFPESTTTVPLPTSVLISERILPLSKPIRNALIDLYCPPTFKEAAMTNDTNRDCLVRTYLGRRRAHNAPLPPNFSLRNYNLCLDQMVSLNLPVREYAAAMAEALALMHWSANIDGYDVEFVLGSEAKLKYTRPLAKALPWKSEDWDGLATETDIEALVHPNFRRRMTRMWLLDFNLCSRWEESTVLEQPEQVVEQLVHAFFENDPYYPLPLMDHELDRELWSVFREEYLRNSDEILEASSNYTTLQKLPARFIEQCVHREQRKLDQGLGHGHRHYKG